VRLEDAEDLWLACVMQAPAYAGHSLVTEEHLSERGKSILSKILVVVSQGWPMVLPEQIDGVDLRTIPRRLEMVDAETTIPEAEKSLLSAWSVAMYSRALQRAAAACVNEGVDAADAILDEARAKMSTSNAGVHWEHPSDVAYAFLDDVERDIANPGEGKMSSGMASVDAAVKNWPPKRMTTIGGWTNEGKSTFGLQILMGLAIQGNSCCMISLEDENRIPTKRMLSALTGDLLAVGRLGSDNMNSKDIITFRKQVKTGIEKLPLHMVNAVGWSVSRVCYAIQDSARRFGCKVVMVDFIQCFDAEGRESRGEAIGRASRKLKAAAAEVGVHLILISQLRRPEDPRNTAPDMHMFKQSGDIENQTEYAMLVWRPKKGEPMDVEPASIIVAKSKDGTAGTIEAGWDTQRHIYTWENRSAPSRPSGGPETVWYPTKST